MGRDQVLVDDCFDPLETGLALDDRNAATPGQDHRDSVVQEQPGGLDLNDTLGERGGHHTPPAVAVLREDPAVLSSDHRRLVLGIGRADELGRRREGWISRVHDGLGDQGDHRRTQGPAQRLLQPVTDQPLSLRDEVAQGIGPGEGGVRGALQRQQADLGPVAVHQHDLSLGGEIRERAGDLGDLVELRGRIWTFAPGEQGVATEGDDDSHAFTLRGWRP